MDDGFVRVEVLGVPLALDARAREYVDGLTREMLLLSMELGRGEGGTNLPARLLQLVREFNGSFSSFGEAQLQQLRDAEAAGETTVDLVYELPAAIGPALAHVQELQREVDEYCRRGGYLLTLETPPDVLAYRSWVYGEFIGQVAGRAPVRWSGRPVVVGAAAPG